MGRMGVNDAESLFETLLLRILRPDFFRDLAAFLNTLKTAPRFGIGIS